MSWSYQQSTGYLDDPAGERLGVGYSGNGAGLDNPKMEADPDVGPVPAGEWKIGTAFTHPHLGPLSMHLTPVGHDAHGRSGFFIHGDNALENHSASHGCIILNHTIRETVAASKDRSLKVVA